MPTYTIRSKSSNQTRDVFCKYSELVEMLKEEDNELVLSTPKIVSGTGSLLSKTDGGWKDTLSRIKSGSAKNNTIKT